MFDTVGGWSFGVVVTLAGIEVLRVVVGGGLLRLWPFAGNGDEVRLGAAAEETFVLLFIAFFRVCAIA
jgi:hypothetical protein